MCRACQRAARLDEGPAARTRKTLARTDRPTAVKEPASVDWEAVGRRLDEGPAEIQTTEDELRRARGEAPGPTDAPELGYPVWDDEGPERIARVKMYAADIDRGRAIRFIPRETTLSGSEARTVAGVAGWVGQGRDRPAAAGRGNRMRG